MYDTQKIWKEMHPIERKIVISIAEDSQLSKEEVIQGLKWITKRFN